MPVQKGLDQPGKNVIHKAGARVKGRKPTWLLYTGKVAGHSVGYKARTFHQEITRINYLFLKHKLPFLKA